MGILIRWLLILIHPVLQVGYIEHVEVNLQMPDFFNIVKIVNLIICSKEMVIFGR